MLKVYPKKSWLEKFMRKSYEYHKKCAIVMLKKYHPEKLKSYTYML